MHANFNPQPLYDEIRGLHQNMERVDVNYGPGGEPARRALEAIEEVRLEGVDSVAQQTRVSIEEIYASTRRFKEGMSMGMQRTYDELVNQMGIEAQRIRESGGLVSEGGFEIGRASCRERVLRLV